MSHESSGSTVESSSNYGIDPEILEELSGLNSEIDLRYMLSLLDDREFDDPLEIIRDLGFLGD